LPATPRSIAPNGLARIFARLLEAISDSMDGLPEPEWKTVSCNLAELALALIFRLESHNGETPGGAQAALLDRVCQTIERALDDPDLSPARVAQSVGISERYLQRLFETRSDNFTHYVRERRLYRTSMDLADPAEAHHTVSEIAFRYGFNDAAHFSRAFRERFGMSPRAYRHRETERLERPAKPQGQRGWPQEALARLRPATPPHIDDAPTRTAKSTPTHSERTPARHHHLDVRAEHVHWGYFSRSLTPIVEIASGDTITVETLTQHASDDPERMIEGDAGAENVFHWSATTKNVDRRGAGPLDASIFGRGAGEGFGVHICTGPIAVKGAEPGDVLEIRILDIMPRPSRNPKFEGRVFGSGVAAWWGYHHGELINEPKPREDVTIYEIVTSDEPYARALYSYRWEPQTDPYGVIHGTYDYPGVPVVPGTVRRRHAVLDGIHIPLRPHFGVIALAPKEADLVDSIPPAYFGGNLDNWRLGKGAAVYLPVSVAGALLSIGDPHAAQGDGEVSGTAIECSMTGTFEVTLHKKKRLAGRPFADLSYPLIETPGEWILMGFSHPNYLAEFGAQGQSEVYNKSSLDLAMKDAFRKVRRFLMVIKGLSEDEAIALMSAAVDFGVTQVVDGNWGVHAMIRKSIFAETAHD
jgi:acetamidase/formamidase/AraC-like DNA-binding protein